MASNNDVCPTHATRHSRSISSSTDTDFAPPPTKKQRLNDENSNDKACAITQRSQSQSANSDEMKMPSEIDAIIKSVAEDMDILIYEERDPHECGEFGTFSVLLCDAELPIMHLCGSYDIGYQVIDVQHATKAGDYHLDMERNTKIWEAFHDYAFSENTTVIRYDREKIDWNAKVEDAEMMFPPFASSAISSEDELCVLRPPGPHPKYLSSAVRSYHATLRVKKTGFISDEFDAEIVVAGYCRHSSMGKQLKLNADVVQLIGAFHNHCDALIFERDAKLINEEDGSVGIYFDRPVVVLGDRIDVFIEIEVDKLSVMEGMKLRANKFGVSEKEPGIPYFVNFDGGNPRVRFIRGLQSRRQLVSNPETYYYVSFENAIRNSGLEMFTAQH